MRKLLFLIVMITAALGHAAPVDSLFTLQSMQGNLSVHLQLPGME